MEKYIVYLLCLVNNEIKKYLGFSIDSPSYASRLPTYYTLIMSLYY